MYFGHEKSFLWSESEFYTKHINKLGTYLIQVITIRVVWDLTNHGFYNL